MKLIDSNILIYSAENPELLELMKEDAAISDISRLEVLGYHQINTDAEEFFKLFFQQIEQLTVGRNVIDKAIEVRRQKNMKIGDAIIAATALLNKATLYTRNIKDFKHIEGLEIIDPLST